MSYWIFFVILDIFDNLFLFSDEKDGETILDILARQTAAALRPKVVDGMDEHSGEQLPTSYDITTLQFN